MFRWIKKSLLALRKLIPKREPTIQDLQYRGRRLYYRMQEIADKYDCGYSVLVNVSPEYARLDAELSKVMQEIKKKMGE